MFLFAYEPSECRARLQPDRVGDRRQMRQVGQCGSRRVFPHLPSRAGDARKPGGLRLRVIAKLAHVLQSAFADLPVFSRRAATENRSLRIHVLHLLKKNTAQNGRNTRTPAQRGFLPFYRVLSDGMAGNPALPMRCKKPSR